MSQQKLSKATAMPTYGIFSTVINPSLLLTRHQFHQMMDAIFQTPHGGRKLPNNITRQHLYVVRLQDSYTILFSILSNGTPQDRQIY